MNGFAKSQTGNAMLRTTTAATMVEGSNASNVLPQQAKVTMNFRIGLADSVEKVVEHIKENGKDMDIDIEVGNTKEPSIISPTDTKGYRLLEEKIHNVYGDILVAPYVVMAATDSVKYEEICSNIYRFAPMKLTKEELATIHNNNERISMENLERGLSFYIQVLEQC
jgi:carboxypeptidase PM20D1